MCNQRGSLGKNPSGGARHEVETTGAGDGGVLSSSVPGFRDPGEYSPASQHSNRLRGGVDREDSAAVRRRAAIMRRFHRVIEEYLDQPLDMPQLAKAVGTSERTLTACCHEHLGMGPKRYVIL